MHFIAGLFLTTVFLCAHIVDQTDFPLPNQEGNIEKNWYVHQMETTANFSNRKSFFLLVYWRIKLSNRTSSIPQYLPCSLL